MTCEFKECQNSIPTNQKRFCSLICAKRHYGRTRYERVCKQCDLTEFVDYKVKDTDCRKCTTWNKGKTGIYSEATKKAMGVKNKGRVASSESNVKRSASLCKHYAENEHHRKGGTLSEEHKAKISQGLKKDKEPLPKKLQQIITPSQRFKSFKELKETMTSEDFIKLYESYPSSRKLAADMGVSRGTLYNYYRDLTVEKTTITKTCIQCSKEFSYVPKTWRSEKEYCSDCLKAQMSQINEQFIKDKPSHRRLSFSDPAVQERLQKVIAATYFTEVRELPDPLMVEMKCICEKWVSRRLKHAAKTSDLESIRLWASCGCKKSSGKSKQEIAKQPGLVCALRRGQ